MGTHITIQTKKIKKRNMTINKQKKIKTITAGGKWRDSFYLIVFWFLTI